MEWATAIPTIIHNLLLHHDDSDESGSDSYQSSEDSTAGPALSRGIATPVVVTPGPQSLAPAPPRQPASFESSSTATRTDETATRLPVYSRSSSTPQLQISVPVS